MPSQSLHVQLRYFLGCNKKRDCAANLKNPLVLFRYADETNGARLPLVPSHYCHIRNWFNNGSLQLPLSSCNIRLRCLRAHLLPQPHIEVGLWLRQNKLANAMIDVSDGLAADLLQVTRESDLEAELDAGRIPLLADMTLDEALEGGEDYALLFTSSKGQVERLARAYPKDFPPYRLIGKLKQGPSSLHLIQGEERTLYQPDGFDHFRSF